MDACVWFLVKKTVGNMGRIIHTSNKITLNHIQISFYSPESNTENEKHPSGGVNGDAPEVHEAHHVDQGEDDAEEDEDGAGDVGEHEDHDEEDATQGENDASEQLLRQDSVNLPEFVPG